MTRLRQYHAIDTVLKDLYDAGIKRNNIHANYPVYGLRNNECQRIDLAVFIHDKYPSIMIEATGKLCGRHTLTRHSKVADSIYKYLLPEIELNNEEADVLFIITDGKDCDVVLPYKCLYDDTWSKIAVSSLPYRNLRNIFCKYIMQQSFSVTSALKDVEKFGYSQYYELSMFRVQHGLY